jgi:lycopene beta-cyclase
MRVDLLIIGGGCAGLSLANELAKLTSPPSTLILEPRTFYREDRTWCFWADQFTNFDQLPLQSWHKVSVRAGNRNAKPNFELNPYQVLRSLDFYHDRIERIESIPEIQLRLGEAAGESRKDPLGGWITETSHGPIHSKYIVDTRPSADYHSSSPELWQTFVGVEMEFAEDAFDPATAVLMHFLPPSESDIRFLYQLPFSKTRGLVELTMLSVKRPSFADLKLQLEQELERNFAGRSYRVVREEKGLIPMGLEKSVKLQDPSYVQVGVSAGSARPSTGYTFCRIQRWAQECARALDGGRAPIGPLGDSPLVRQMDNIFLRVLKSHAQLAPEIFVRLFEKVPAARLSRFLGDSPTILDALSVVSALPKLPFLRECLNPAKKMVRGADGVSCYR